MAYLLQHQALKMLLLQLLDVWFVAFDIPSELHDTPGQLLTAKLSNSRAQGTHETRFIGNLYIEANKLCIQYI